MTQDTPLEKLINSIKSSDTPMDCIMKAKQLFEEERINIIKAYSAGFSEGKWQTDGNDSIYHAKKYFNNNFNPTK